MRKYSTGVRRLLYYSPQKNCFYFSNELRQRMVSEIKLKGGRTRTVWFAFRKIPSDCISLGQYD